MGLGEQGRGTKEFLTKFHALESLREGRNYGHGLCKDDHGLQTEDFIIALDEKHIARCHGLSL